jgi:FixJ family two-component response regulator
VEFVAKYALHDPGVAGVRERGLGAGGLPDMDGVTLATAVREQRPRLPVVIASGMNAPRAGPFVSLAKPYDENALRRAIEQALATR